MSKSTKATFLVVTLLFLQSFAMNSALAEKKTEQRQNKKEKVIKKNGNKVVNATSNSVVKTVQQTPLGWLLNQLNRRNRK